MQSLVDEIKESDSDNIIILHGSDTLAFTSSFIANLFWDKNIVLTASDKPIEDNLANGISNFNEALRHIKKGEKGVFVSYDGIFPADTITSADGLDKFRQTGKSQPKFKNPCLAPKNILVIKPYINIDYNNYNILCILQHYRKCMNRIPYFPAPVKYVLQDDKDSHLTVCPQA